MSLRKLAVAAAVMLVAVSASASNFRAADQVYIPAAGKVQGSSGTFISDVYLANLTGDPVSVSVIYQPQGAGGGTGTEFRDVIKLAPHERKEFLDFFPTALSQASGFGQLIFNGCLDNTSCGPETQDEFGWSQNFRTISAQSRIYQIANNAGANPPTTGQLLSGIPWYNFVSSLQENVGLDKVFITGITHTGNAGAPGTFRANLGVVNASEYSSTTIVVRLYQGTLNTAGFKGEYQVPLGPLANVQFGFATAFPNAPFGRNYFVTVEQRNNVPVAGAPAGCTQGCPAFLAYGSVIDNLSGDATTLEAQYLVPLTDDAIDIIYPSGAGKNPIRRSARH
jgi:hypothetical protein